MKILKLIILWLLRLNCWWFAPFFATVWALLLLPESFVSDALQDFFYRWPRICKCLFFMPWNADAFYYCWRRETGGLNEARWMPRRPKNAHWVRADHWWIFGN